MKKHVSQPVWQDMEETVPDNEELEGNETGISVSHWLNLLNLNIFFSIEHRVSKNESGEWADELAPIRIHADDIETT